MAGEVRKGMVEGAMALLARRGLHATSFSEVLAATGTVQAVRQAAGES